MQIEGLERFFSSRQHRMEYASMEENIYYFGVQSIMKRKLENQYGVLKKNYIMCYQLCHQLIKLRLQMIQVVIENFC